MTDNHGVTGAESPEASVDAARRQFLGKAGRFAAVTPPAITLLLGTSLGSQAIAGSNGSRPHQWPGRGAGHGAGTGRARGRGRGRGRRPGRPGRGDD